MVWKLEKKKVLVDTLYDMGSKDSQWRDLKYLYKKPEHELENELTKIILKMVK